MRSLDLVLGRIRTALTRRHNGHPSSKTEVLLIGVHSPGGTSYHLHNFENSVFEIGATLTTALPPTALVTELPYPPAGGLHLDLSAGHAMVWTIRELAGLRSDWPRLWPGWQLEFHNDRYEEQLARCDGPSE